MLVPPPSQLMRVGAQTADRILVRLVIVDLEDEELVQRIIQIRTMILETRLTQLFSDLDFVRGQGLTTILASVVLQLAQFGMALGELVNLTLTNVTELTAGLP